MEEPKECYSCGFLEGDDGMDSDSVIFLELYCVMCEQDPEECDCEVKDFAFYCNRCI